MKKIITAIGDQNLNKELKKEKEFEIISEDISYQEGILELLETNNEINFLILSELLTGNYSIKELIEKIKILNNDIKIIIILEKENKELENYLYAKGIYFIFYNSQIEIKEIINLIKNNGKSENTEIKKELNELKKILLEKEEKSNLFKKMNKTDSLKTDSNRINNTKNSSKEVICVTGTSGVGKSIFSINLAKSFMEYKNKILIIDFDILNNSLHTILGIKKYPEKIKNIIKNNNLLKEIKIEELILKVNSKIDLISGINLLFDSQYKISNIKIKNIISKLKENYDIIIIDTSSECFFDYTKEIIKNSNTNIFITEANLLEIKKAKRLLNIYINEWEIPQANFNILFNKYNKNSIDFSILKNIFSGFSILGKLSIDSQYNLMINKNDRNNLNNNLQKEYFKINKKLIKNKNSINFKNMQNNILKLFQYFFKNKKEGDRLVWKKY